MVEGIIDTHTHLYANELSNHQDIYQKAISNGISACLLPNIDTDSIVKLKDICKQYPKYYYPMMGLHPCSVNENYTSELQSIKNELYTNKYIAVGEIGLDFYWDKTWINEQELAFKEQLSWALDLNLPISIHTRSATYKAIEILKREEYKNIKGVFHCFSGSLEEANEIVKLGFKLGIGGVVTYKNSNLGTILKSVDIDHIVLETDAPYLPPVPYRGKTNEPSYLIHVVEKLSQIFEIETAEVIKFTYRNAFDVFKI